MCAWSSPYQFAVNGTATAAILNTYASDNLQYLHDNRFTAAGFGVDSQVITTSADLTCTNSYQDIAGGSMVLSGTGTYVLIFDGHVKVGPGAAAHTTWVQLTASGTIQPFKASMGVATHWPLCGWR